MGKPAQIGSPSSPYLYVLVLPFWLGLREGERRFEGWGFDLLNPSIREWTQRGFGASPNLVGSHFLYFHSGLLAHRRLWFFPARGFHINLSVYLWFDIYIAILVDRFLSCLLLVPFCPSSWCMLNWHMRHTCVLWYVNDGDWCVNDLLFACIFLIVKFGQHHVWRVDVMGLFSFFVNIWGCFPVCT